MVGGGQELTQCLVDIRAQLILQGDQPRFSSELSEDGSERRTPISRVLGNRLSNNKKEAPLSANTRGTSQRQRQQGHLWDS